MRPITPAIPFDESRPHPYVDPVQPNGLGLTHQTPGGDQRITVRNPIMKNMPPGYGKARPVDWKATAEDLAKQLLAMNSALHVSRELTAHKQSNIDMYERRVATLEKQLANQRETIREYRNNLNSWILMRDWLHKWWAWRLFAPGKHKQQLWQL